MGNSKKQLCFNPLVKPLKIGEKYIYFDIGNWKWFVVPEKIHEIILNRIKNEEHIISLLPQRHREVVERFINKLISLQYLIVDLKSLELGKGVVYTVPLYTQLRPREGYARINEIILDMSQQYSQYLLEQCKNLNVQISGVITQKSIGNVLEICNTCYIAVSDMEMAIKIKDKFSGKKIIIEVDRDVPNEVLSIIDDINSTVIFHIPLMIEPAKYPFLEKIIGRYDYYFTYCFYTTKNFIPIKSNDEIDAIFRNPKANTYILKLKVNCNAGKYSVFVNAQGIVYGCIHDTHNGKDALTQIEKNILDLSSIEKMKQFNIDTVPKCQKCSVRYFCADTCENKNVTKFLISCEFMKNIVEQNI